MKSRGALGVWAGFAEPVRPIYRTKDDPKVKTCLGCSHAVEDGMSFSFAPSFPARKATYDLNELENPKQDLFTLYPEAPLCRNCNACTEACPQQIDVREGVWKAVFGDFKAVSETFMDCVMCGLCVPVCIADIAPNLVGSMPVEPTAYGKWKSRASSTESKLLPMESTRRLGPHPEDER